MQNNSPKACAFNKRISLDSDEYLRIQLTTENRSPKLYFDATKLKTKCYLSLVRFKSNITVSLGNDVIRKILET